jgi:ABC-2 type transport system permease protein
MAKFNPFYYAVEASRSLFAGNYADMIILKGFAVVVPFTLFSIYLAVRSLNRMSI